jgi:HK97 family phage major capsid protein
METGLETKVAFGDMMQAFEAFKDANDERLEQIEKRMSADVVTAEKVDRINRAVDEAKARLDELTLKSRRPQLSGETAEAPALREHKQAFDVYVRKGEASGLSALEAKALSVGSGPDGGFLVPPEVEAEIGRRLYAISPIRAIASVRQVSASLYKKPFSTNGLANGWVGETQARPETASITLAEMQFPAMELYAMPSATQTLLDDSVVNIDQWLAEEVQLVFAEQEAIAFISGNGVNRPKGFLDYTKVVDASWSWGNVGYLATGVAGAFAATNPSDRLIDLAYALRVGYRQNASWVMNRRTQAAIRKFRDSTGNYIWQPSHSPAGKATLMGFPVTEAEAMPDMVTDSFALAFGDFAAGYLIVDRVGVRVLRDPYSAKPYVLFYTTKRVGGGIQNFEAIKLMKFGLT